ncbi:MAG TPA: VTT domain-containing protein [Burkholderiaceae bacterium]|nr:VTT domain-containing protein [Burkholderiaceae bacterium]
MLSTLISLPLDQTVNQWLGLYGSWAFGLVALLVFVETGLVFAPFLPGDSLLFITGAAVGAAGLGVHGVVLLLVVAAVAGDALNFAIGRRAGPWLVARFNRHGLKRRHLALTRAYFRRFGPWTIVVARFVPVVRTLAPFLAGAGRMPYARFAAFNVLGGTVWVASLVYAGAWLGALPLVKSHIGSITIGIVALSLLPMMLAAVRARVRAKPAAS